MPPPSEAHVPFNSGLPNKTLTAIPLTARPKRIKDSKKSSIATSFN
jgi:hypothetical protein